MRTETSRLYNFPHFLFISWYYVVWSVVINLFDAPLWNSKFAPSIHKAWIVTNWTIVLGHHQFWLLWLDNLRSSAWIDPDNLYYKCMHLIIHFDPGATQLFLHTPFLLLLFNILTEMPIASSSSIITCSTFRLQFKEPECSPISTFTMNSASTEQNLPCSHIWFTGHSLPWLYSLAPLDGQHGQEGQSCRCNVLLLQKSFSLWSLKHIKAHAFIDQTCMAAS